MNTTEQAGMQSTTEDSMRFEFGRNWSRFVRRSFNEERLEVARKRILEFTGLKDLAGFDFLDIGCGSGIHSYAAQRSGAARVRSFDYDPHSVAATRALQEHAGRPGNWTVERGDVLDAAYLAALGKFNFVYSWGVLHHTGAMWTAVRNAASLVADGGLFYIALYSADADFQPSKEFWLDVKQRYNRSSWFGKEWMLWWYVWRFMMQKDWNRAKEVFDRAVEYKTQRGMDLLADIRDWLGGWPMEYAGDQETVDLLEKEYGFRMLNADTGQACSEFLFARTGVPSLSTNVKEFMAQKKAAADAEKTSQVVKAGSDKSEMAETSSAA
jgi:2-polyprenyl-6-hydroxyphenyl methylase/3-demethylubiquinone-9 3-methyltransferase